MGQLSCPLAQQLFYRGLGSVTRHVEECDRVYAVSIGYADRGAFEQPGDIGTQTLLELDQVDPAALDLDLQRAARRTSHEILDLPL